ncbi:MAG: glycosyltransferase family 4 protein [Pseudomonadota bacterium]
MKLAFYAPMKPPDHPTPSGDREIARLTLQALDLAGYEAMVVSNFRALDMAGSTEAQADLMAKAGVEAEWLVESLSPSPPDAWLTYHCYYKAPDLIGPVVAGALQIPYLISEPSISPKRRLGEWSRFAFASEAAISHADCLLWTTTRDLPELQKAGHSEKLVHLPAFLDPGPVVPSRGAQDPIRLLTIAMMRPGAKMESYKRLAAALDLLEIDWELTVIGGGDGEAAVSALFADHLARVSFLGTLTDPGIIRIHCERHDLLVWPGVEEGVGMVWLEAQAAGLPIIAEDGPAARNALGGGRLTPPEDPRAMADAIRTAALDREAQSRRARAHIDDHHSLQSAAVILHREIEALVR